MRRKAAFFSVLLSFVALAAVACATAPRSLVRGYDLAGYTSADYDGRGDLTVRSDIKPAPRVLVCQYAEGPVDPEESARHYEANPTEWTQCGPGGRFYNVASPGGYFPDDVPVLVTSRHVTAAYGEEYVRTPPFFVAATNGPYYRFTFFGAEGNDYNCVMNGETYGECDGVIGGDNPRGLETFYSGRIEIEGTSYDRFYVAIRKPSLCRAETDAFRKSFDARFGVESDLTCDDMSPRGIVVQPYKARIVTIPVRAASGT